MLWDRSKNGDDKSYLASVNDSEQYRYVTYKRTSMTNTELDEMRIMVINPVVNEITTDGNKVTVEFSDELAAASVTSEKISVTNGEEALGIQNLTVKDYSVSFEVEDAPEFGTCDITIARTVRNTKGVTMAADYNGSVAFGDGINVNSLKFDKEELTAGDTVTATADLISALTEEKTVILITAVKNTSTGELLSAKIDRQTIEAGGTLTLSADVTLPSSVDNISVEAFVWENKTMIPLYGKTIFGEGV